jgi:tripartite-type tricarboxylate transporter receptor subunit TctC
LAEAGGAGYDISTWNGLVGPANMPPDVVKRLNQELCNLLQDPQVRSKMISQCIDPVTRTPEAFSSFIEDETKSWAQLLKKIKVDLNKQQT